MDTVKKNKSGFFWHPLCGVSGIRLRLKKIQDNSSLRIRKYGASEKVILNLLQVFLFNKKSHRKERKRIRNEVFEVGHDDGFSQRPDRSMGFAEKLMIHGECSRFEEKEKPPAGVCCLGEVLVCSLCETCWRESGKLLILIIAYKIVNVN